MLMDTAAEAAGLENGREQFRQTGITLHVTNGQLVSVENFPLIAPF